MKKYNCILLVDDDEINNYLNLRLLKKLSIAEHILIAKNGEEALECIQNLNNNNTPFPVCPDLIFLDLNMPVMSGLEFIREYQKRAFKNRDFCRIIILTTSSHNNDIAAAKELGMNEYLNKPLTEEKLNEILHSFNI